MAQGNLPAKWINPRPLWFNVLLLVDAFALGGLAVWRLVLNLFETAQAGATRPDEIGLLFHLGDVLVPYWFGQTAVSFFLVWITAGAFVWLKTRWKVVPAATLIIPLVLVVWLVLSRR